MTYVMPAPVRQRLEQLAHTLQVQLGPNLVSLLVFGSAVRGGYDDGRSDVDLVLVLKDTAPEVLLAIANTLTVARTALRFEAVILKEDEIARAADVFPLFYDDIRSCHLLLAGRDVFANLPISDAHRRVRIEQELRECQIRLRRVVVDSMGAPQALAGAIERKVKQIRSPMHALLNLRKTPPLDDKLETVLAKARDEWSVDIKFLQGARKNPTKALEVFNTLLTRMIEEVDRMEA